jgi:amino acid permease
MIKHKHTHSISRENTFIILSATVLCPIFCIIAHSPYIAIAYLNDGDHASSIFIYYMVLCYLLFGVIWLFFHWCQHFIDKDKKDKEDEMMTQDTNENENDNQGNNNKEICRILGCCTIGEIERGSGIPNEATPKEQRRCFITAVIILVFVALLFLLGLIVVISCYFVLIPINKSISNAPNRLLSIYQSAGFLIGSFIVFNIIKYFHAQRKKEDIGENVDKIHIILQNWLFHPRQQFYRLQEQLNELEKKSKKIQKQLSTQQGNPTEEARPEDHPAEEARPEDHPAEEDRST